jgi:ADP-heptose:LPS heptosyltransferase
MTCDGLHGSAHSSALRTAPSTLLVMRAGAIGDLILTMPALAALREHFPNLRLLLAARADMLPLLTGSAVDDVIPFDSLLLSPLFTSGAEFSNDLRAKLGTLELAVLWLPERPARTVGNSLKRLGAARLLDADPLPYGKHAADHLLDTLAPLGIHRVQEPTPMLTLPDSAREDEGWQSLGIGTAARVVALHVGSGGEAKRWPVSCFVELARLLAEMPDTVVLLIRGPAEEETPALTNLGSPRIIRLASPSLTALATILTHCALYVGNDSGITHLAAALGLPTVALFGPTDPAIWGPRGRNVTIVRSPDTRMSSLEVVGVWQTVLNEWQASGKDRG